MDLKRTSCEAPKADEEKKNGKIIAIITMIFLFGMISFVTNLSLIHI